MNNDLKTGIGFLIPASALVGFVTSLIAGNYLLGVIMAVAGILGWFVYMAVMESTPPKVTGNVIILFGVLLSLAIFLNYGWEQSMFGGFELRPDGFISAIIILFFSIMLGVVFRRSDGNGRTKDTPLSEEEMAMVKEALARDSDESKEPKVIVIKQETPPEPEIEEKGEEYEYTYDEAYAYPPEYYEDYEDFEDEEEEEEE